MKSYVITCCSTVDLTPEVLQSLDVSYAPFHYYLDSTAFEDDLFTSLSASSFYKALSDGASPRTSQVNADEFIAFFKGFLEAGQDILHIAFSSGLSGTVQAARVAADTLSESYPDRRIAVIDSLSASSGYGLLVTMAANMRLDGKAFDDVADWVEKNKGKVHHWFFSTDLTFYVKGGRLSRVSGWFGTVLKICPLLNMDAAGKLVPRFKLRGKKRAMEAAFEQFKTYAEGGEDYDGLCYLSHSDCYGDARALADAIEAYAPRLCGKIRIFSIGPTIGCHTGPGTVALFFMGSKRD